ncbi:MAG: hypothetical protein IH840_10025 [Candidatus Heimdallarchaeota archaeon]|nr:hypothetical protein [Candidatus Heimdallarchaeota archaeon]
MEFDLDEISFFLNNLSSLISVQASPSQTLSLFDSVLGELNRYFDADHSYIMFQVQVGDYPSKVFSRAVGLPEEQCTYINNYARKNLRPSNPNNPFNRLIYQLGKLDTADTSREDSLSGVKTILIIPIMSGDPSSASISLYFKQSREFKNDDLEFISSIGNLITNAYTSKLLIQSLMDRDRDRNDYFWKLYDAILILDEDLKIIDTNESGREILGYKWTEQNTALPIADFTNLEDFEQMKKIIQNLRKGELSREVIVDWSPKYGSSATLKTKLAFGFTKIQDQDNRTRIISSARIQQIEDAFSDASLRNTLTSGINLVSNLSNYRESFIQNPKETIEIVKEEIFPSSFIFIVNEITGPQALSSSPEVEMIHLLTDIIPLMSSLNTEQIITQHYITGSVPWSNPDGELRWISFVRQNDNARGNVEIHLIGIVVQRDLLTILPQFVQILLGILLGGMNKYLELLEEDDADFITSAFHQDRNFSTLTLIKDELNEMRSSASEIFGATLTGSTTLQFSI